MDFKINHDTMRQNFDHVYILKFINISNNRIESKQSKYTESKNAFITCEI